MFTSESIKQFTKWIQAFDHRCLQNKDDVEQKFIIPMFLYLCYPDKCRIQYTCARHEAGKYANNSEIVQIYFATDGLEQQNAETSIIIVKSVEPQQSKLDVAIEEMKFYGSYFNSLFFAVTNGYEVKVFKRLIHYEEESVFDLNIDKFKNTAVAYEFYNALNFNFVKNIDKNTASILPKYNLVEKLLRRHPDLQDILDKCDFEPSYIREDYRLMVVQPKVAIACNLPQAFGEGDCEITFSNILFKGLKISLNHQDILGKLMIGLNTKIDWGCRRFIKQIDKNVFEVCLGQIKLILSEVEAGDLCLCVDRVCQEYKNSIVEFEDGLETWDFDFVEVANIKGLILFSVGKELWQLMQQFANDFDYTKGKSEWHLFHQNNISIRVSRGIRDHTFLVPQFGSQLLLLSHEKINIIYELNNLHFKSLEKGKVTSWQQDIGQHGMWTARYTKKWLLEKYIPKVINYYLEQSQLSEAELLTQIINYKGERSPIKNINNIKELLLYLRDIQSWLNMSVENIAATLLQRYYQAFTDLVRNTDSSIIGIDYIMGNLQKIQWNNTQEQFSRDSLDTKNLTFKLAMHCLDEQVVRINSCEYEKSLTADLITRTLILIIENGKVSFSQSQLNAAKEALIPLWEYCRFEVRYVYTNR